MQVHHSVAPPGLVPFAVELFVLGFHCCLCHKTDDNPFLRETGDQVSVGFKKKRKQRRVNNPKYLTPSVFALSDGFCSSV